jgi:hypothetical protein
VPEVTRIPTAEKRLRSQQVAEPETTPEPWLVLAECTDEPTARALAAGALGPGGRAALGAAPEAAVGCYRLQITMDPA